MATITSLFTSAGTGCFDRLVRKRQALATIRARLDALYDADPCDRRCTCPEIRAAQDEEFHAAQERDSALVSWREYCAIRGEETGQA